MDERKLLVSCLAGDEESMASLYALHAGSVVAWLLRSGFPRADADDLLQETFLRAMRSLATFDPRRGTFRVWIGAIARNVARGHWGRRRDEQRFDPDLAAEVLPARDDPAASPENIEESRRLRDAISELPGELRRLLELRYVDGLTGRAAAEAMGLPESTARLRLQEAYRLLEKRLASAGVSAGGEAPARRDAEQI
jgi:RNA polymerase sigma-70 factor, ECF subfamily